MTNKRNEQSPRDMEQKRTTAHNQQYGEDFYQKMGDDVNHSTEFYQGDKLESSDSFDLPNSEEVYEKEDFYQEMGDDPAPKKNNQ